MKQRPSDQVVYWQMNQKNDYRTGLLKGELSNFKTISFVWRSLIYKFVAFH